MGSEQSSNKREKEPAVSPQDLQRALEHQRMMYEQKIKNIMTEKRNETTAPASSQNIVHASTGPQKPSTAGLKQVHEVLENSKQAGAAPSAVSYSRLQAASQQQTVREWGNQRIDKTQDATTITTHQQPTPTVVERQRTPYSYNQNDLPSPANSNPDSLYPNLRNAYSASPQGNNNMGSPVNQPCGAGPKLYSAPPGNNNMGSPVNQPCGAGPKLYSASSGTFNYGAGPDLFTAPDSSYQNNSMPQRYTALQPSAPPVEIVSNNSRSRSQSRQRGSDNEVNCVTCGQMYGERIYQCNQGHSSCEVCKTRQVACGACKLQITARRNFDLEKYIMEKRVRCPNSKDGCQLFIKMGDMAIHEKECPFQALQCPSLGSNCNWKGKLSQLAGHFKEMHPLHNQGEVDKEMFMSNVINNSHTMHYVQIGPFNFLFHIKVSQPDAKVYMAAQLIGTKHSAAKWDYEIQMYKKNEPRRKYQYVDRCSSANQPLQEIISSTQCAVIPQDYVKTFICGGTVAYKFYIKKDDSKAHETAAGNTARDKSCGPQPRRHFKKFVKKH